MTYLEELRNKLIIQRCSGTDDEDTITINKALVRLLMLEIVREEVTSEEGKSAADGLREREQYAHDLEKAKVFKQAHIVATECDPTQSAATIKVDPKWLSETNRVEVSMLKRDVVIGPLCNKCYCTVLKASK